VNYFHNESICYAEPPQLNTLVICGFRQGFTMKWLLHSLAPWPSGPAPQASRFAGRGRPEAPIGAQTGRGVPPQDSKTKRPFLPENGCFHFEPRGPTCRWFPIRRWYPAHRLSPPAAGTAPAAGPFQMGLAIGLSRWQTKSKLSTRRWCKHRPRAPPSASLERCWNPDCSQPSVTRSISQLHLG
jgi:hypothetical protein